MGAITKFLDGKKTIIAGISAALTALALAIGSLSDGLQLADLQVWGGAITAIMTIFGLGGKLQKIINALKN